MDGLQSSIQLCVEELCLALGMIGKPEVGKSLLYMAAGEISAVEEQGRLLAAGHSLLARNLLMIRDGQTQLVDELKRELFVLVDNDFIIQYNRKVGNADQTLAYFVKDKAIVQQSIEQGVVYRLSASADRANIITGGIEYFGIEREGVSYPEVQLPQSVLEKAKEASAESVDSVLTLLKSSGVPEPLGGFLSEDFQKSEYRGAAMRIEDREGKLVSDEGFFLLKGPRRIWLFPLMFKENETYVRVLLGTSQTFTREVKQLIG